MSHSPAALKAALFIVDTLGFDFRDSCLTLSATTEQVFGMWRDENSSYESLTPEIWKEIVGLADEAARDAREVAESAPKFADEVRRAKDEWVRWNEGGSEGDDGGRWGE
jgi:hypothetical protein